MKIVECPRDAMQGLKGFIPTPQKAAYINRLLQVGFHTIDFGSFVSPKAIPQLRDTAAVLKKLELDATSSQLLAIVANPRGANDACLFDEIRYLGYPFSVSETFQLRNTNATLAESLKRVESIQQTCIRHGKKLVVYLSMGFGNPYGDPWNAEIVANWAKRLAEMGIGILALSDTIGVSDPKNITHLFTHLIPAFPEVEFGAHLHTTPHTWEEKVHAAYSSGCRRFDSALKGYGGCPMAEDQLVGNMPTEQVVHYLNKHRIPHTLDRDQLVLALQLAGQTFPE